MKHLLLAMAVFISWARAQVPIISEDDLRQHLKLKQESDSLDRFKKDSLGWWSSASDTADESARRQIDTLSRQSLSLNRRIDSLNYFRASRKPGMHATVNPPVTPIENSGPTRYKVGLYRPTIFAFDFTSDLDLPADNIHHSDPWHPTFFISPMLRLNLPDVLWMDSISFTGAYNGLYDFYAGTLSSGPVISRLQNPELFFSARHFDHFNVKFGWAHESNGMFITHKGQFDTISTALPHLPDDSMPYRPQDFASMGWNYWDLETKWDGNIYKFQYTLFGIGKYYFNQDDLVGFDDDKLEDTSFFVPIKGKVGIPNYNGIILGATLDWIYMQRRNLMISVVYNTGYRDPFTYNSYQFWTWFDLPVTSRWLTDFGNLIHWPKKLRHALRAFDTSIPLYVSYNLGYSKDLAYYAVKNPKLSAGLILSQSL
jgi:hypothetical protein